MPIDFVQIKVNGKVKSFAKGNNVIKHIPEKMLSFWIDMSIISQVDTEEYYIPKIHKGPMYILRIQVGLRLHHFILQKLVHRVDQVDTALLIHTGRANIITGPTIFIKN